MIPECLKAELQTHLESVRKEWQDDVQSGYAGV